MLKLLLAVPLVLASVPAVPQTTEQSPIPKVICRVSGGYKAGSAFRVGPTYLLTALHVVSEGQCEIDGQPIKVVYKSAKADFAILEDKRPGRIIPVDCGGYIQGHQYVALGHARGLDQITVVSLIAMGRNYADISSLAILAGVFTVQPGQSGGPIVDSETMKVVGIVNTGEWERGLTGSIELKNTPVCGGAIA